MTSPADSAFRGAIAARVQPALKEAGFTKMRNGFKRSLAEVVQLVTFQKSTKSTKHQVVFTVNFGVASRRLLTLDGKEPAKLRLDDCHWWDRASVGNVETWWTVADDATAARAAEEVATSLQVHDVPRLDRLGDDRALCSLWLSDKSPGLTDTQRLLNLVALLRFVGPAEDLKRALDEVERKLEANPRSSLLAALRGAGAS